MNIALTVIVHVHNTCGYLRRCLDSLLRQGMKEVGAYELICVDDGSSDGSGDVLLDYARRYPGMVKLIIQDTKGVARSRNAALEQARGEYVAFVNGDDYLVEGGYGHVLSRFARGERRPDVISFWNVVMTEHRRRHWNPADDRLGGQITFEGDGTEAYNRFGMSFATDKLFRLAYLREKGVRFEDLRISEDAMFCFRLFQHNPHIVMTSCNIYRYTRERDTFLVTAFPQVTIIFMLESVMYLIKVMNNYLRKPDAPMHEGVRWALDAQLMLFHTRALAAHLERGTWIHHMSSLLAVPIHTPKGQGKWRLIALALNLSAHSYLAYLLASWCYRHLFDPHLRKRLG